MTNPLTSQLAVAATDPLSQTQGNVAASTSGNAALVTTGSQVPQVAFTTSGNGTSPVVDLGSVSNAVAVQIAVTGTLTAGTIQLLSSLDGTTFTSTTAVNLPTSANAVATLISSLNTNTSALQTSANGMPARYIKLVLAALSGGTVTAKVASVD